MSKIVIIFYFPYFSKSLVSYYDGLVHALSENHDLLVVNNFDKSQLANFINEEQCQKIVDFHPDLIITFNHVINDFIYQHTNCNVLIIEADLYPNGFHNIDLINKYSNKIFIATANNNLRNRIKKLITNLKEDRFIILKNSTSLASCKETDFKQNISFIGTLMGIDDNNKVIKFLSENINNKSNLEYIKTIIDKALYNIDLVHPLELKAIDCTFLDLFRYISFLNRIKILENVNDLGLKIYGKSYVLSNLATLGSLIFSINEIEGVLNALQNQEIYNQSKISINLHFAHNSIDPNLSCYSWRVCDIMATNSCLVSTFCPALDQDFGKWVKIPQFSNRHEAYDLCKKLLAEENLRKDTVEASQLAIKEGKFTFAERAKEIAEIFNLKPVQKEPHFDFLVNTDKNKEEVNKDKNKEESIGIIQSKTTNHKNSFYKICNRIRINLFRKIKNKPLMRIVKNI
jgi:spore maturation protein CgeB